MKNPAACWTGKILFAGCSFPSLKNILVTDSWNPDASVHDQGLFLGFNKCRVLPMVIVRVGVTLPCNTSSGTGSWSCPTVIVVLIYF